MKTLALIATALFAITAYDAAAAYADTSSACTIENQVICGQANKPLERCPYCHGTGSFGTQRCIPCQGRGFR